MASDKLAVSEAFGPTVQGEGPEQGRAAMFLRLGGCNLACSWCDTPYTWDGKRFDLKAEIKSWSLDEVVAWLMSAPFGVSNVVVTGGEPMLQQEAIGALLRRLAGERRRWRFAIETAGTIAPELDGIDTWVVSPKLANSGNDPAKAMRMDVLQSLRDRGAAFKFVVTHVDELEHIAVLMRDLAVPRHRVWIMPEGTSAATLLDAAGKLVDRVVKRGWNLTLRQHVLLWGNERKR